jgi:hypothetical protein
LGAAAVAEGEAAREAVAWAVAWEAAAAAAMAVEAACVRQGCMALSTALSFGPFERRLTRSVRS